MSGLCGVVDWGGGLGGVDVVGPMVGVASYRGGGGVGLWGSDRVQVAGLVSGGSVGEGLAVGGDVVVVGDVRIDNREELVGVLGCGVGVSGVGLVLAAYGRWGEGCVERLVGDFAFVVWDGGRGVVLAARDVMGMRPLYFHVSGGRLVFGSEVRQVLAAPGVPVALDEAMLAHYLLDDHEHLDRTMYAGVHQLEPGHALRVSVGGWRSWRYWDVDPGFRVRYGREGAYVEHFLEVFSEAVRARVVGGGRVGVLLSGGMDSGSVASVLGWLRERGLVDRVPVHTYSWAFDTLRQCDERHISDVNAGHYGFAIHPVPAEPNAPLARYPDHGPHHDDPFIGIYQPLIETALAQASGDGVDVMFSGDRGDLMVGGWDQSYLHLVATKQWGALRHELREHARLEGVMLAGVLIDYVLRPYFQRVRRAGWRRGARPRGPRPRRREWVRDDLLGRTGVAEERRERASRARRRAAPSERTWAIRRDLVFAKAQMKGMVWSERTYASAGLTFADPWSDRRLASFVLAVPPQVLNRPGRGDKRLVREAMRGIMPEPVRQATAKILPTPLFTLALRRSAVQTIQALITDSQLAARGYVDGAALQAAYASVRAGERDGSDLWSALTLEMWLRRYWS